MDIHNTVMLTIGANKSYAVNRCDWMKTHKSSGVARI